MEKRISNYNFTDIWKWLSSVFVVAIHTQLFDYSNIHANAYGIFVQISTVFLKSAVPFFFMISAFFMGKKINWHEDSDANYRVMENNCRRIFSMYFMWSLIYVPATIILLIKYGFTTNHLVYDVFISLFTGGSAISMHLWFLYGLFFSLLLTMFLIGRKLRNMWKLVIISFALFALRQLNVFFPLTSDDSFFNHLLMTFRFDIFVGPLYCTVGLLIAKFENEIREKIKTPFLVVVAIVLIPIFVGNINQIWLLAIFSIALTLLVVRIQINGNSKFFKTIRTASTNVYLIHIWVLFALEIAFGMTTGPKMFLFVLVISNILAFGQIYIKSMIRSRRAL